MSERPLAFLLGMPALFTVVVPGLYKYAGEVVLVKDLLFIGVFTSFFVAVVAFPPLFVFCRYRGWSMWAMVLAGLVLLIGVALAFDVTPVRPTVRAVLVGLIATLLWGLVFIEVWLDLRGTRDRVVQPRVSGRAERAAFRALGLIGALGATLVLAVPQLALEDLDKTGKPFKMLKKDVEDAKSSQTLAGRAYDRDRARLRRVEGGLVPHDQSAVSWPLGFDSVYAAPYGRLVSIRDRLRAPDESVEDAFQRLGKARIRDLSDQLEVADTLFAVSDERSVGLPGRARQLVEARQQFEQGVGTSEDVLDAKNAYAAALDLWISHEARAVELRRLHAEASARVAELRVESSRNDLLPLYRGFQRVGWGILGLTLLFTGVLFVAWRRERPPGWSVSPVWTVYHADTETTYLVGLALTGALLLSFVEPVERSDIDVLEPFESFTIGSWFLPNQIGSTFASDSPDDGASRGRGSSGGESGPQAAEPEDGGEGDWGEPPPPPNLRLTALLDTVQLVERAASDAGSALGVLEDRVSTISDDVSAAEGRLETLGSLLETVERRADTIDTRVQSIAQRTSAR